MRIILASNNAHKLTECRRIIPHHTIDLPSSLGEQFYFDEQGSTFVDNAFGKARACWQLIGTRFPVLADDSGISVDALNGRPGLYSARYGREQGISSTDDAGRTALLLQELGDTQNRRARYLCAAVLLINNERFFIAQESWEGMIARDISTGTHGFGYDPIFIPDGLTITAADIDDTHKDTLSHRGKALRALPILWRQ